MRFSGTRLAVLTTSLFLLTGCCVAKETVSAARLGQKIADVTWKDASGKPSSLYDRRDGKATVVVFLSFECPVSTSYAPALADLAKSYTDKGVHFIGVCPCDDSPAALTKQAEEFKVPFPVYKDDHFAAVDAFAAGTTPEAFVLDAGFVLRYRGRIDDSFAARLKKKPQTTRHDLRDALDDVLAGKDVREPATAPVGCPIARESAAKPHSGDVTFYRDVLPVLQKNCQACHRTGEVGPFSLMTYKQAKSWATDIKEYTETHRMPPWKPAESVPCRNERKMSDRDVTTLAAWVDAGTPEGDAKDAPPPAQFPSGWQLGQPDLVLTPDVDFHLGSQGKDLFRCFVLPTHLTEDRTVVAIEVRPGNPRVVHHTLNFIDTRGRGRKLDQQEKEKKKENPEVDNGPGYDVQMGVGFVPDGGLGGWAPGHVPHYLPPDTGYFLPKGSDVIVQVHYHRNGRVESDRIKVGLYFAKKPVSKRFQSLVIPGRFLFIPAGQKDFVTKGSVWVDRDCHLYSAMPHMHMLGRDIKITATPPDGPTQVLVWIKDWDYNWQETYFFKEPLAVKKGTRLDIEAHYDNTADNPRNPHQPPRLVRFGEQTTDEMCFGFVGATADEGGRVRASPRKPADLK